MEKEIEDGEITDYDGQDEDTSRQNTVPDQTITLNHHSGQTGLNEVRHNDNNTTYYDRDARPRTETTDHERPIIEYDDVPYIELDEWSPDNDLTSMTDKKSRSQTINKENATSIKLAETTTHAMKMHNKRNKDDNHNTQKNEPTRSNNSQHSSFESRGIDAHSSDKQYNNKNRSKRPRSRDSERDGHEKSKRRKISQFPRGNHKTSSSSGRNRTDSHKGRNGTDSPRGRYGPDPSRGRNGIDLRRGRNRTYSPVRGNSSMSDDRNSSSEKYDQNSSTRHSASKPRFIDHRVPTKVSSTEHCNDTDERINKIKEHVLREQNKRLENCSSTKLHENGEPVESRFSPDRVQENRPYSPVSERSLSPNQDMLISNWTSEDTTCRNFGFTQEQEARLVVNDSTPYEKKDEVVAQIYVLVVNWLSQHQQRYLSLGDIIRMINNNPKFQFEFQEADVLKELVEQYDHRFVISYETNIWPKTNIKICPDHTSNPKNKHQCNDLHMCTFYMLTTCTERRCKFGHALFSDHNRKVLQEFSLGSFNENQIRDLIRTRESRNVTTLPLICKFYNNKGGCSRQRTCKHLHVCTHFVNRDCKFPHCKRAHTFFEEWTVEILESYYGLRMATNDSLIELISQTLENGNVKLKREIMKVDNKLLNQQHDTLDLSKSSETGMKSSTPVDTLDVRVVNSITENPQMKWSDMALKKVPEYIALESNDNNDNLDNGQDSTAIHGVTPQSSSLAVLIKTKSEVETKQENIDLTERETEQGHETVIAALSTSDVQVQNEISDLGKDEMLQANGLEMKNDVTQLIQDVKVKDFDKNEAISRVDTQEKRSIAETVISEDVQLKGNDQAVSIYDSSDDAKLDKTVSGSTSDVKDFYCTEAAIDSQITVEKSPNKSSKATQIKQFLQNRRRGLTADIKSDEDFVTSSDDSGISHSLHDNSIASTPPRDESKSPLPETSSPSLPAWKPLKPTSPKPTICFKDVPYSIGECAGMRSNKSKLPGDEYESTVHDAGELAQTTEDYIEVELKDEDYIKPNEECANGIKHIEEIKHTNDSENNAVGGNETDAKYNSDNDNENQTVSEWCDSRKVMIKSETNTENGKDLDSENNTDLENETKFDTNIEYGQDNKENTEGVFEMDMLDSERRNAFDEKIARRDINVKEIGSGEEMDIQNYERSETCNDNADNDIKEDGDNGMINDQILEPGNESVTGATDDDVSAGDVHMVNGIANGNDDGIAIVEELSMELKGKNTSVKTRYRHISGYWQMATSSGLWKDLDAEDAMALQNAVNIWKNILPKASSI